MSLWQSIVKSVGYSAATADHTTDEYIDKFFDKSVPPANLGETEDKLKAFVERNIGRRRLALVTAGCTVVPLNDELSKWVEGRSNGNRPAAFTENLVRNNYAVIYLHRQESIQPFLRHVSTFFRNKNWAERLHEEINAIVSGSKAESRHMSIVKGLLDESKAAQEFILPIPFFTVEEYLFLLRACCRALSPVRHHALLFLGALVSDHFVPRSRRKLSLDKDDNKGILRRLKKDWCPGAFIITIRHGRGLNPSSAIRLAHQQQEQYGVHVTLADVQGAQRYVLVTVREEIELRTPVTQDLDVIGAFEKEVSTLLIRRHKDFVYGNQILRSSKPLLLLSAKFSMMKENDVLNEDADGNRNVLWDVGVKVKPNRRDPNGLTYNLKAIFKNTSHSARCNVWETVEGSSKREVLVVLSPAGTPDTIKEFWGDFWSGWADEEFRQMMSDFKNLSWTSTLEVVSAPLTGDWQTATALFDQIWRPLSKAWTDGERTRIRQSFENMWSMGLNRRLTEFMDLQPVDRIAQDEVIEKAKTVRVHETVYKYFQDMMEEGLLSLLLSYVKEGTPIHITGYSMGGMLSQVLALKLGDEVKSMGLSTDKITVVGFGTPKAGDAGFAARMRLLYRTPQLLNIMYAQDVVHAFPPKSEGYESCMLKIFLKEDGWSLKNRGSSNNMILSLVKALDRGIDAFRQAQREAAAKKKNKLTAEDGKIAAEAFHKKEVELLKKRKSYVAPSEPNPSSPAVSQSQGETPQVVGLTLGEVRPTHEKNITVLRSATMMEGESDEGGNEEQSSDVGFVEILAYFQYHHFLYYNANLSKSVDVAVAENYGTGEEQGRSALQERFSL